MFLYLGCDLRKPVFGVSDQVIPKPACSATETSQNSEILLVASFDNDIFQYKANNKGADQTVLMCRLVCTFVVGKT